MIHHFSVHWVHIFFPKTYKAAAFCHSNYMQINIKEYICHIDLDYKTFKKEVEPFS